MLSGPGRRLASLIVFLMIFTASCNAIGPNRNTAQQSVSAQ
jgi:hypothetical protein